MWDQFIVYAGYGEVMHRFQTFELLLWQFLVRGIKRGSSLAQGVGQGPDKIIKWDNTTAGAIVRGLKSQAHWPDGMIDSLQEAVETRNYLADHFLREYFDGDALGGDQGPGGRAAGRSVCPVGGTSGGARSSSLALARRHLDGGS